jgi:hypothetical protein
MFLYILLILFSSFTTDIIAKYPSNAGNYNDDNSCFMHATVQALFHSKPLRTYLENNAYATGSTSALITNYLNDLGKCKDTAFLGSRKYREAIAKTSQTGSLFSGYNQEDASEFAAFIFLKLEEDLFALEVIENNAVEVIASNSKDAAKIAAAKVLWKAIVIDPKRSKTYVSLDIKEKLSLRLKSLYNNELNGLRYEAIKNKDQKKFDEICEKMKETVSDPAFYQKKLLELKTAIAAMPSFEKFSELLTKIEGIAQNSDQETKKKIIQDAFPGLADDNLIDRFILIKNLTFTVVGSISEKNYTSFKENIENGAWDPIVKQLNQVSIKRNALLDVFSLTKVKNGEPNTQSINQLIFESTETITPIEGLVADYLSGYQIKHYPEVLILQLKRERENDTGEAVKDTTPVSFPLYNLDVTGKKYHLFAIVCHGAWPNDKGVLSMKSGHYYAYAKYYENGVWYEYNDATVTKLSNKSIEDICGQESEEKGTPYMLFYHRSDIDYKDGKIPDKNDKTTDLIKSLQLLQERLKELSKKLKTFAS